MSAPLVYKTDVLIVGGGFAGSWAAIGAAQNARDVLIVDKAARDWRGLGMMSGGDMIVMRPEFNVDDLLDEIVYYYDGLCDQPLVRKILEHSYDRFCDLERWGHKFARDEQGKLRFVVQRGLTYMRYYLYHPYGKGGPHTCNTLYDQIAEKGVRRLSHQSSPLDDVLHLGTRRIFPKDSTLSVDKSFDDVFFYITRGHVCLFHDMPSGKSIQVIQFFKGNTFATSISVVSGSTDFRTFDLHYTFPCETETWCFPAALLVDEAMIRAYPQVIAYALKQQCLKTLIMHRNFAIRNEESAEKMIGNFAHNMLLASGGKTELNPELSQTELAATLGIHRTTLNRALRRLRRQGILGEFSRDRLVITDVDKLRELVLHG